MSQAVALPYAKAAFEYAEKNQKLKTWSRALEALANAIEDPKVYRLLKNPSVDSEKLNQAIFDEIFRVFSDEGLKNFIHLLANNKRLIMLPEIFQQFEKYRIASEKITPVQIISASPIPRDQQEKLMTALKIRLQSDVKPQFIQDQSIIAGAVIRIGDKVIDASISNLLSRMLRGLIQPGENAHVTN